MPRRICILVSIGRHPRSGRPRRAPLDARAVELGLRFPAAELELVHAGDPQHPVLRDYLGMGAPEICILPVPPGGDVVPTLIDHLAARAPDMVLTGRQAEGGEDSGFVPYALGAALGYALVPDIVGVEIVGGSARLRQALPYGQRRQLACPLPLIATVNEAAPTPRQNAFAKGRRGRIVSMDCRFEIDYLAHDWEIRPARHRPKRIAALKGASPLERLAALSAGPTRSSRMLRGISAEEAARAIYADLEERGLGKRKP